MKLSLLPSLLSFLLALVLRAHSSGFQYVTCGSVLKLYNIEANARLHSHEVKYGSGSGQQSVTGVTNADDVNSYWVVKGPNGQHCSRGAPLKCDSVIRLKHLNTHLYLHSHTISSPLSGNQEVSCYGPGDGGDGNKGDNWVVECSSRDEFWTRDTTIRLKHQETNKYLHIAGNTYGRPIQGQKEISGVAHKAQGNLWKAMEGVYMDNNL